MEEYQTTLNPMMPRRYSAKERELIRKTEKEIITGKKENNTNYPYPLGTYLSKEEYGVTHIDKVEGYVLVRGKVHVILVLDVLKEPRLSTPIDVDRFLSDWHIVDNAVKGEEKPKVNVKTTNNQ